MADADGATCPRCGAPISSDGLASVCPRCLLADTHGGRSEDPPVSPAQGAEAPSPYKLPSINLIYNMLFCDDLSQFRPEGERAHAGWQATLFNPEPDAAAIRKTAENKDEESRVRVLAYNWLRTNIP